MKLKKHSLVYLAVVVLLAFSLAVPALAVSFTTSYHTTSATGYLATLIPGSGVTGSTLTWGTKTDTQLFTTPCNISYITSATRELWAVVAPTGKGGSVTWG